MRDTPVDENWLYFGAYLELHRWSISRLPKSDLVIGNSRKLYQLNQITSGNNSTGVSKGFLNIQFWNADIKFPILDFWNSRIQRKWNLRRNPGTEDYDLLMLISLVSTKVSYFITKWQFSGSWITRDDWTTNASSSSVMFESFFTEHLATDPIKCSLCGIQIDNPMSNFAAEIFSDLK